VNAGDERTRDHFERTPETSDHFNERTPETSDHFNERTPETSDHFNKRTPETRDERSLQQANAGDKRTGDSGQRTENREQRREDRILIRRIVIQEVA
jgi:hypothetical protein